jgi:hypothetical protein
MRAIAPLFFNQSVKYKEEFIEKKAKCRLQSLLPKEAVPGSTDKEVNPLAHVSNRCSHFVTVFEDDMFISIHILHYKIGDSFPYAFICSFNETHIVCFFSSATARQTVMPWKANTSAAQMAIYTEMSAR